MDCEPGTVLVLRGKGAEALTASVDAALTARQFPTEDRREFERSLRPHRCGIVCFASVADADLSWLAGLVAYRPDCPVLLVTPLTGETGRILGRFPRALPELVWADEVRAKLSGAVFAVLGHDPLVDLLCALETAVTPSPLTSRALRRIAHEIPPIGSVRELAASLDVTRGILHEHWTCSVDGELTLKELLGWVVLLRAAELSDRSLTGMAFGVGVHRRTLERLSVRRLNLTAAELRRVGRDLVLRALRERLEGLLA